MSKFTDPSENEAASVREGGREMDAEVAERVMGWRWYQWVETAGLPEPYCGRFICRQDGIHGGVLGVTHLEADPAAPLTPDCYGMMPCYSTDIGAAWEVFGRMLQRGGWIIDASADGFWVQNHTSESIPLPGWTWDDLSVCEHAPTAPLAICKAALQAISRAPQPESLSTEPRRETP